MSPDLRRCLGSFLESLRLPLGGHHGESVGPDYDHSACDDLHDIENAVEAFRQLVTRLTQDSKELGELYAESERKAERYALLNKTVIENVSCGILVVDKGGRMLLLNSSARRIIGITADADVTGKSLNDVFRNGTELLSLVHRSLTTGQNLSRQVVELETMKGERRRLGVTMSCVAGNSSPAEAVVAVFTRLDQCLKGGDDIEAELRAEIERQSYLRGVLDSYDLLSKLVQDFSAIEAKSNSGTLTTSELSQFSESTRQACDTMMAFSLSVGIQDSVPELVDVNAVLEGIIAVRDRGADSRIERHLTGGLPPVHTLRKVLETGLDLLIRGCMEESTEGVRVRTGIADVSGFAGVTIDVEELSHTRPVVRIGTSLREFVGSSHMRREAGLFLLASLPPGRHQMLAEDRDGFFHFSLRLAAPIEKETGPSRRTGRSEEIGRDEG
jgi:PAS domain S-box-containing protein